MSSTSAKPELSRQRGIRLSIIPEPEAEDNFYHGVIKELTGDSNMYIPMTIAQITTVKEDAIQKLTRLQDILNEATCPSVRSWLEIKIQREKDMIELPQTKIKPSDV